MFTVAALHEQGSKKGQPITPYECAEKAPLYGAFLFLSKDVAKAALLAPKQ